MYSKLPAEIWINSISIHLNRIEQHRLFSSSKHFLPILHTIRYFILNNRNWDRFVKKADYRELVLQLIGCTEEHIIHRRLVLEDYRISADFIPVLSEYVQYFQTIKGEIAYPQYMELLNRFASIPPNLLQPILEIKLSIADLYKLHRLFINEQHEVMNLYELEHQHQVDSEDRTKPLSLLR